jgi:D-alanyl-D-alanine carboxypeptidase (penicillin-binding protein 5/6)
MLVMSGNDAAHAVQTAVGSRSKTLSLMNEEAAHIQANDTHAESPHGLDRPGQFSSAYDLALLSRAALKVPDFRKYVSTIRAEFPAPHGKHYEIYTHDHLLLNYRGAFGVKNGYTVAAQASFVGAAKRHGHRLVAAVMHANPMAWMDVMQLLTWGFKVDGSITPIGTLVDPLPDPSDGTTPAPAPAATTASNVLPTSHNGPAVPTAPMLAAIAVVVTFIALRLRARSRRRKWRYRSRYSLPKV